MTDSHDAPAEARPEPQPARPDPAAFQLRGDPPRDLQRGRHATDDFQICFQTGIAENFGAELDRLTARRQRGWQGMQHAAAIAQAGHALTVQKMRIDACHLRRHVGTHAEAASGELINQLEGREFEQRTGAGQQRIEVFEQRRHHLFVTMPLQQVEDRAAQALDGCRFVW